MSSVSTDRMGNRDETQDGNYTHMSWLWMPDRNDEDTKFVRAKGDDIPTKKYPQAASEVSLMHRARPARLRHPLHIFCLTSTSLTCVSVGDLWPNKYPKIAQTHQMPSESTKSHERGVA